MLVTFIYMYCNATNLNLSMVCKLMIVIYNIAENILYNLNYIVDVYSFYMVDLMVYILIFSIMCFYIYIYKMCILYDFK